MRTGSEDDETCATFVLHEEDHTLGNSLRYIIMKKYDILIGESGPGEADCCFLCCKYVRMQRYNNREPVDLFGKKWTY